MLKYQKNILNYLCMLFFYIIFAISKRNTIKKIKIMEKKTIEKKLYSELVGENFVNSEFMEKKLTELVGDKWREYDCDIDNACFGDEENAYVIKSCFENEQGNINVKIYYGDNTLEIGDVSVY
jgi:hypothetical protein